jgi:hypothetical protein
MTNVKWRQSLSLVKAIELEPRRALKVTKEKDVIDVVDVVWHVHSASAKLPIAF